MKWKKIDFKTLQEDIPIRLNPNEDICIYAREYISGGGYAASIGNNLVSNFKKKPSTRGTSQWVHKENAIRQFAEELHNVIGKREFTVMAVPPSKLATHEDYDSRFEDMFSILKGMNPKLKIETPIRLKESMNSASGEGGTRDTNKIYDNLKWVGFNEEPTSKILLVDDVVTTGGHYKASKKMILENHPDLAVIGVFWAMTTWENQESDGSELL